MRVVPQILRLHAETAAFLWAQHAALAAQDPCDEGVLAEIGERLEAELDALEIAGPDAWPALVLQIEDWPERGEVFVFARHALLLGDPARLRQAVHFAGLSDDPAGVLGALRRSPPTDPGALIARWLAADGGFERRLGLAASVQLGLDPGAGLADLLDDDMPAVRAEACRAAAAFGRRDLVPELRGLLNAAEDSVAGAAAEALAALGDRAGAEALRAAIEAGKGASPARLALVIEDLGPDRARQWITDLWHDPALRAVAVRAAGATGARDILPWLVRRMAEPEVAQAAGAAFVRIHGAPVPWEDYFYPSHDRAQAHFDAPLPDPYDATPIPIAARFAALIAPARHGA